MIRRVADRVAPAVEALVVNCREPQVTPLRWALAGYEHPVSVDADLLTYLFDRAAGHDAAVLRLGEWFQPTHAVYCQPGNMGCPVNARYREKPVTRTAITIST